MTFVIGFGSTEAEFEELEFQRVTEFIEDQFANHEPLQIFTGSVVTALKKMLKVRQDELKALDKQYTVATEYPDRYSTYWSNVLSDGADLVVIFHFFHINRRHGMSPDGWASFQTTKLHHLNAQEVRISSPAAIDSQEATTVDAARKD